MMTTALRRTSFEDRVSIPAGSLTLEGLLSVPVGANGIVLFADGSGSSSQGPRNHFVAEIIRSAGLGTLLFDLLTPEEARVDTVTHAFRFEIPLLTQRLAGAVKWLSDTPVTQGMSIGLFGAGTGAAAAIVAAAELRRSVKAIVSRGGRPDLAGTYFPRVSAPTLLIVGSRDKAVVTLNQHAFYSLKCVKELAFVPGATYLFEEPGALDRVAELAAVWFGRHLPSSETRRNYETQTRNDSRQAAAS